MPAALAPAEPAAPRPALRHPGLGHSGLRRRLETWRDDLLASPRFQHWAARFPLTRPLARRRATALFDLCAGFVYAQVLRACVELDVPEILAAGPHSAAALAPRLGLAEAAAQDLLDAAAALGIARRTRAGLYAPGPLGAALRGKPGIGAMVLHHARLYADLADPVTLLRGGRCDTALAAYWPYAAAAAPARLDAAAVAPYSALMAISQPMIAAELLHACDLGRHRAVLDVGGGEGAFLIAAAERHPALRPILFDLPAVAARAAAAFARAGLGGRASCVGGDFRTDALPPGADLITLIRVLHDHDDATVAALLAAARAALPRGGRLLVAEPMRGTRGAERVADAYFAFYLRALGSGRPRSPARLTAMMQAAGFTRIRERRTAQPMLVRVLSGDVT
ncbi:MAG TPA: methyltransferase [Acetobacteraceae bacterium]|nr:methyltransferase [Acetobacteraceae bacterium]